MNISEGIDKMMTDELVMYLALNFVFYTTS